MISFSDHTPEYKQKFDHFTDAVIGLMAANIEIQIKTSGRTPFNKGGLRSGARHYRNELGSFTVEDNMEYAAAQEAGIINGSPIKNYSTPGTGPHWFQSSIDTVISRKDEYIETAKRLAGL